MTGFAAAGLPLENTSELEIWVNDFRQDPAARRGTLHVDLGSIDEDFAWPDDEDGHPVYGTWQFEDLNQDGIFAEATEDCGLDALIRSREVLRWGSQYLPDFELDGDSPYPAINNTAGNGRDDSEDVDRNTRFDSENRYLTLSIDLANATPEIDVAQAYPDADLQGTAWRKYVLLLDDGEIEGDVVDAIDRLHHLRIWFDDLAGGQPTRFQLARVTFR